MQPHIRCVRGCFALQSNGIGGAALRGASAAPLAAAPLFSSLRGLASWRRQRPAPQEREHAKGHEKGHEKNEGNDGSTDVE